MKAIFTQDFANNWQKGDIVEIKPVDNKSYLVDGAAAINKDELKKVADIYDDNDNQISKGERPSENKVPMMTKEKRLALLKQIEKDIYVCSIESTLLDDAKSCAIHSAIEELEQRAKHCKWIKYDHRTICPKEHDIDDPYWRIPEDRKDVLKYCPYCGLEIEIDNT